jgi:hypothetical protein
VPSTVRADAVFDVRLEGRLVVRQEPHGGLISVDADT